MGVAPRRFTDATVSDAPKDGQEEDASSGTQADTATAVQDDVVAGPAPSVRKRRVRMIRPRKGASKLAPSGARRPVIILTAAFGVLVVALAAIAIKLGLGVAAQQRQQGDQQAVLQAARQAGADLMTVSYQTAPQDINRILSISTGSFRSQVSTSSKQLINETTSAHAVSKANVLSAGLVGGQVNGNTATVILVVDSTITSKNAPNGVVNHYRETITLSHTGGRWLASQVSFATPSGGQ